MVAMAGSRASAVQRPAPQWRLALAILLAGALLLVPLRRQQAASCPQAGQQPIPLASDPAGSSGSSGSGLLGSGALAGLRSASTEEAIAAAVGGTGEVWWPTTGDTVHLIYTANGSPYVNYQTLALYGSWRRARRMPGGDKMVALTRVLHRSQDDDLSPYVPTYRVEPRHPDCDGRQKWAPTANCSYVIADRPGAIRQFFAAAAHTPGLIKAPWVYLLETDYLFVKPVASPGPAESGARALGFFYDYVYADAPRFRTLARRLFPAGLGPLSAVPRTGPAPIMARVSEWLRVIPRWEGISQQIEADQEIRQALGWVREMYAFSLACAVERWDPEITRAQSGPLIIQPPVDLRLGNATQIHYTWGPKLQWASNGTLLWAFEKRLWREQRFVDEATPLPMPPPYQAGWKTPSGRVGPQGAPTSKEDYDLIVLEAETFNAGLAEPTVVDEPKAPGSPAERRSALETEGGGVPVAQQRAPLTAGEYNSAEEALDATGWLADRPPQAHGETGHAFYTVQPMQLLSLLPRAYLMPKFLDKARCQHVIDMASKRLAPSGLAFKKGDTEDSTRDVRTSSGTFLSRGEDPAGVLAYIEDKIAAVTMVPVGHGEPFNVLRYELDQHYDSHYDSFAEEDYGPQASQRIATVLVYLADVEDGGETSFLLEGKDGLARLATIDYKACDTGIKVKPKQGDALLFWNTHVNGTIDKHSLHGGCPVVAGTKWAMTKWIRNKCFGGAC
ncbi:hypothetical protein COHA_002618 [Chlorella ohadii]|uniref:Fe2OG dioxygenase domain-containing protein n=1 Tax=Chlorella ohadii TaxID=2649997 RepID=A0AAD5DX32_9CHLO|nr:hypothetical protein COHA_002618 [Chlorella ohadii]